MPAPRPDPRPPLRSALLCLAAAAALAAGDPSCDSTAACLQRIEAAQTGITSITARFTQTKHLSLMDEPLVSTGRFTFARPDKVRLDIETPRPAAVIVNGRQIAIPGLSARDTEQLGMTPMAQLFTELGAMFGGSPAALQQHFAVTAQAVASGIAVTLTPHRPEWQQLFRRIELTFAEPDLTLQSMQLHDALGDRLEIVMTDVQRNPAVPDHLFAIPTPAATP